MIFYDAKHGFSVMKEHGNLNLQVVFRRNILRQEIVYCLLKIVGSRNVKYIVNAVIFYFPIGFEFIINKRRMQNRSFFKEADKHRFQRFNINFKIVMKLNVNHSVVKITEKVVHFIPKLGI